MVAKAKKTDVATYFKQQLTESRRYEDRRDLLNALLEEDKQYSIKEVDELIEDFDNKEVK